MFLPSGGMFWSLLLMDVSFVVAVFPDFLYVFCVEEANGSTVLSSCQNFSFSISNKVGSL